MDILGVFTNIGKTEPHWKTFEIIIWKIRRQLRSIYYLHVF